MSGASSHLSIEIDRPSQNVYDFVRNPENLHLWAAGLSGKPLEHIDGAWFADSPMGRVAVKFAEDNSFGVLDHEVTLPDGTVALNPVRVLPVTDSTSEVIFSARRREMNDEDFAVDQDLIRTDLRSLKEVLER